MSNITIKDIAKALGLSASTVSRALRDSYEIGIDTKKRVVDYAKEHHYTPNPIALGLKENKTKAIGILVPEIDNPFFSQAINGIEAKAHELGYHVLIFQSYESFEREIQNLNQLLARRVDGIIISLSAETNNYDYLKSIQKNTPILLFDRVSDEIDCHHVITNNFNGAFKATEALILNGRRRIGVIGIPSYMSISKERHGGYFEAYRKYRLPIDYDLVKESGYTKEKIIKDIHDLLSLPKPPDAILTMSDRQALICLEELQRIGIDIPKDLGLVCFSNLRMAQLFTPSLSTVSQPAYEMGQKSAQLMIEYLESKHPDRISFQKIIIDTTFHERESSKKGIEKYY